MTSVPQISPRPRSLPPLVPQAPDATAASRMMRYGSLVPVLGGAIEVVYGLRELRAGTAASNPRQKLDGRIDMVRGATALLATLSDCPLYVALALGSTALNVPIVGVATACFSFTNAAVDAGRDIYEGVLSRRAHPDRRLAGLLDIGAGVAKIGAGGVLAAGCVMYSLPLLLGGSLAYGVAAVVQNPQSSMNVLRQLRGLIRTGCSGHAPPVPAAPDPVPTS